MKILCRLLLCVMCCVAAGCAEDNTPPPTPLTKQAPKAIHLDTKWRRNLTHGAGDEYVQVGVAATVNMIVTGDHDGNVVAANPDTGRQLWKVHLQDAVVSATPTITKDTVYVGTLRGTLYALNAQNGQMRWQAQVNSSILAPVAVSDNFVVVHVHDGDVVAFNATTGKQKWLYNGTVPALVLTGDSAPSIDAGLVVVGTDQGELMAFDIETGIVQWERPIALPTGASEVKQMVDVVGTPVIQDGVVYAATYHGNVVAVMLQDGRLVWQHTFSSYRNLTVGAGRVFVTSADGVVAAFDTQTGRELWHQDILMHRFVTGPALVDNYIVVGDFEGYIHWLAAQDGRYLARSQPVSSAIQAQPAVLKKVAYVASKNGRVAAITPR